MRHCARFRAVVGAVCCSCFSKFEICWFDGKIWIQKQLVDSFI
jgi:hypothetical protein